MGEQSQESDEFKFDSLGSAIRTNARTRNVGFKFGVVISTLFAQLVIFSSSAFASITPGEVLDPLNFNATFITDIAASRTSSSGLSDFIGQVGSELLKNKLGSSAICTRAVVQSVSRRQITVEIECAEDDGAQFTVAAYSEPDKASQHVMPVQIVLSGGQAKATLVLSSSAGLRFSVPSKFLVVTEGHNKLLNLSGSSTSLFSMPHEFSQGPIVRPETVSGTTFRGFQNAAKKKVRRSRQAAANSAPIGNAKIVNRRPRSAPSPSTTVALVPKFNRTPIRKKQNINGGQFFQLPVYEGKYPISACQSLNRACGKPAADAFCRREGFSRASSFSERINVATRSKPSVALSDGSLCSTASCKVLAGVSCVAPAPRANEGMSNPAYTYRLPRSAGFRVGGCLNWGKECGKPAADAFCKIKGYLRSKTHTLANGVSSASSPTLMLNSGQTCRSEKCGGFEKIQCTNSAASQAVSFIQPIQVSSALLLSYSKPGDGGPSPENAFSFADIVTDMASDINTADALPFHHQVWRDTKDAGVYYYAPKQFRLSYGKVNDGKLGIDVLYGNDDSAEKPVTLTLHFDTGIDESDVKDLRLLMQRVFLANDQPRNIELRRFPVAQDPTVSFELFPGSGEPRVLSLDNHRFSTLSLQWSLTESVWQQWQVSLRDQNHSGGSMILNASLEADNQFSHSVDIVAKAIDPAVYGLDVPRNFQSWKNETPFPVTLHSLNGLGELGGNPASVSWTLKDTKLEPGEQVVFEIDTTNFPRNLRNRLVKYWLDYRLDTTCQNCVDRAMPMQAVSSSLGRAISFKLPSSYDASAYEEIQIVVRSEYFTPQASRIDISPMLILSEPGQVMTIKSPLYLPDGRQLSEGGLAEAKITVITSGGERTISGVWFDLSNERTFISASKIQNVLDANQ